MRAGDEDTGIAVRAEDRAAVDAALEELLGRAARLAGPGPVPLRAMDAVARLERHRAMGHVLETLEIPADEPEGPLSGIPFGVKDLFDLSGRVTHSGAIAHRERPPAVRSAEAVRRLEAAGAIPVATLAMDEFAHGFTTINEHDGICRNPHDRDRIAGGSSGGSAAAVAIGDVPIALGSDTNGSVRVPASLCGVYGVKPGLGRIPTTGMTAFAPTLDHVGFFARTAAESRLVLDALLLPSTADLPPLTAPRVARLDDAALAALSDEAARGAVEAAAKALGVQARVSVPSLERAMDAALLITAAEGAAEHLDLLRARPQELGRSPRIGLTAGALLPASALAAAHRHAVSLRAAFDRIFAAVDAVLLPATPTPAPRIEETRIRLGDGRLVSREPYLGVFTSGIALAGLPAISVPIESGSSLPIGVQLVGPPGSERRLIDLAERLEQSLGLTPLAVPEDAA